MSRYIYADIIAGIDQSFDLVECWLPLLINPNDESSPAFEPLQDLHSSAIAVVGLLAVEQYASAKRLRQGTVEDFRKQAFEIFKSIRELEIFENGQLQVLEGLQNQKPELADWVQDAVTEIRNKKDAARTELFDHLKRLLLAIKSQQARKGHKGGRVAAFGGKEKNPALHLRDLIDSELLTVAVNSLGPSLRNEVTEIKKQVRILVKDWINRGVLRAGQLPVNQATDMHCKRITRKLDKLHEKAIIPLASSNTETELEEPPANDREFGGTSGK